MSLYQHRTPVDFYTHDLTFDSREVARNIVRQFRHDMEDGANTQLFHPFIRTGYPLLSEVSKMHHQYSQHFLPSCKGVAEREMHRHVRRKL